MKIKNVFLGVGILVLGIITFCLINTIDKNKKHPYERYTDKTGSTSRNSLSDEKISFEYEYYRYEILGYDIVEDSVVYSDANYSPEYFNPAINIENFTAVLLDEEAVIKEVPELENFFKYPFKYAEDKYYLNLFENNRNVIEKNIREIHPSSKCIFVKMRITCLIDDDSDESKTIWLNNTFDLSILSANPDDRDQMVADGDVIIYFDKTKNPGDDSYESIKEFRNYKFSPGETIETTIGFLCSRSLYDEVYIGIYNDSVYEALKSGVSLAEIPVMVPLVNVERMNND